MKGKLGKKIKNESGTCFSLEIRVAIQICMTLDTKNKHDSN